ncbi:C-type lectin domain family 2 member F-like [Arvicanthis niloticus]|uniref:C-type lectin domain family 2 member F-like n=1 Tax=Arvicanthis niloticus TaxID=61156 RepID=UPI00402B5DA0
MTASQNEVSSTRLEKTEVTTTDHLQEGERGKNLSAKCLRNVFPESPAKLYSCFAVMVVFTVVVIVTFVALSVRPTEQISIKNSAYAACPKKWIGVGNKCFYFSEHSSNWTSSQDFCMAQGAQLARIDNQEELNFLKRYNRSSSYWISLHRESSKHLWRWTDNTEYNNWVPIHGDETHGFLSDRISSGKSYIPRKWICSKCRSTLLC